MTYYTRDCRKLKFRQKKFSSFDEGSCAKVYYEADMIYKKYYTYTESYNRLSPDMFDMLKIIDSENFIKLYDIYSNMSNTELFQYQMGNIDFITDLYTAKYYHDEDLNLLKMPTDYILENLKELEIIFNRLTEMEIITKDLRRDNTIINSNNIIIIDPDLFTKSDDTKELIGIQNKKNLLLLIESILIDTSKDEMDLELPIIRVFNTIKINENTSVTDEVAKKLQYTKKPLDLFSK